MFKYFNTKKLVVKLKYNIIFNSISSICCISLIYLSDFLKKMESTIAVV